MSSFISRSFALRLLVILLGMLCAFHPALGGTDTDHQAADRAWTQAIGHKDKAALEKLMDAEFTWTDRAGHTQGRTEFLAGLGAIAAELDTDVNVTNYKTVTLVRGLHAIAAQNVSVRFARVWVKRAQGWKLLVYQETTKAEKTPEKRSGFGSPSNGTPVACDNPCKSVPYKPEGAAEKEVVAMWQAVEQTVLTNDVDAWMPNFTDDFVFVTPDGGPPLNKADRIAMIKELKRTNTTLIPAEVVTMKVWALGDTAVMRSEHKPRHGKTLHITRVFVKRGGHWQIAFGQQTVIE